MKTRNIRSLEVSPVGMGCMGFSHGYGEVPEKEYSVEAIRKAYEKGCTFFDTAEVYGQKMFYLGHNEEIVGKAIEPFRENIVLATKFYIDKDELSEDKDLYTVIREHLNASLKNLKTDYVDLYYLHRVNEEISLKDIAIVMGQLIDDGLIKEWGVSQVSLEMLTEAHEVTPIGAVQNLYNMMERDCEEEIIPYCIENGISLIPFSPTASGFLSGKVTIETKFEGDDVRKFVPQLSKENIVANQPILDILEKFASEKNATNAQISLAWMLHKYPNIIPIPGSKNQGRILENLDSWDVELTDEEFEKIESALNSVEVHGHRGHVESQQSGFGNNWKK
ncbi:aldo/keto reductase [Staphylococcus equorum]|uniref:aldo/keto reductase n=1 Tax=Staphylococcus equorum TaxID=246432 RepID=UPI000D1C8058|nr:aldo/keto reductase [Staphylococcus equorum]PTE82361.1 aldo/keto reductase [Staphylococcus equorum]PTF10927.1 aldo/keto reductase [Staphylococcus equorum]